MDEWGQLWFVRVCIIYPPEEAELQVFQQMLHLLHLFVMQRRPDGVDATVGTWWREDKGDIWCICCLLVLEGQQCEP